MMDMLLQPDLMIEMGRAHVDLVIQTLEKAKLYNIKPDGLFVSNGPGDPAAVTYVIENLKKFFGKLPIFGICLGHQMIGLALKGQTYKLKFGHHGANHPVKDFIIRHQGGSNDAQYAIGNLKTEKGDFRIHILLKKVGPDLLIHQVRIEPDNEN